MAGDRTVPRGRRRRLGWLAAGLAGAAWLAAAPGADAATLKYAAVGDSFTSGPSIRNQVGPVPCLRSDHDYPALAAPQIGDVSLSDESCSGAAIYKLLAPRKSGAALSLLATPPQLDAIASDTDIVTLQLGLNDAELPNALLLCSAGSLVLAFGTPCRDHYVTGGSDHIAADIERAAPGLGAVIRGIYSLAPSARVLVLGYPRILPGGNAGCAPGLPLTPGDVAYLRAREEQLNAMISTQAAANGAEYVDLYARSLVHDICRPVGTRWVEGLLSGAGGSPFNPNVLEMQDAARAVVNTLSHPAPQPPPACPARRVTLSLRLRTGEHLVRGVLYVAGLRVRSFKGRRRHVVVTLPAGAAGFVRVRVTVRARSRRGTRTYSHRGVLSRCGHGSKG